MGAQGIILGSRGSDLALAQVRLVQQALSSAWPELKVEVEIIRTSGDEGSRSIEIADRKAGRKGMFTREIEKQLLDERIDLAVHSAKDLPSQRLEDLEIGAVLPRGRTGDVLITKGELSLTSLPKGAVVATGSVRRTHQLLRQRPDLRVVNLRGNVPTRLRKLGENADWAGIILARAGLERLGIEVKMEELSEQDFVPAGGQGIVALQVRRHDERLRKIVRAICHETTLLCLQAEREFLRLLDGDCDSPVGVHASIVQEQMHLYAQVFTTDGSTAYVGQASGPCHSPEPLAAELFSTIYGD
ncbi:MAG: hydroxymethylbilane synthase [Chthoniobacterales bacterium]